jgi:hypothetical protein
MKSVLKQIDGDVYGYLQTKLNGVKLQNRPVTIPQMGKRAIVILDL